MKNIVFSLLVTVFLVGCGVDKLNVETTAPSAAKTASQMIIQSAQKPSEKDISEMLDRLLSKSTIEERGVSREKVMNARKKYQDRYDALRDDEEVLVFRAKGRIEWPFISEYDEKGNNTVVGKYITISVSPDTGRIVAASMSRKPIF